MKSCKKCSNAIVNAKTGKLECTYISNPQWQKNASLCKDYRKGTPKGATPVPEWNDPLLK